MLRPTATGTAEQRVLLGILFVCLAGLMFPVMNAFSKELGGKYSPLQISWARFFGHVIILLILFLPKRGWRIFVTRRPGLQLTRTLVQTCSNLSFTSAIYYQPIADAAAIGMMGPLFVALLAWPMLGERTTMGRAVAVLVGFVGVLIVIRPGGVVYHWSATLLLGSAMCYALYQIFTRKVANIDPPETTTIYSSLFGAIGLLAVLPFIWKTPMTFWHLFFFCGLGVIGGVGHYLIVRALAYAPANVVSPFQYFQLLGSVAIGYVWFGDFPDAFTWLGSLIIVGAGLYVGWSQTRKAPAPV